MRAVLAWLCAAALGGTCTTPTMAQAQGHTDRTDDRTAKGIQDNSFLIEESYNQEPGVVQHISSLRRQGRDWAFTFIQEWPLGSQTHQFSYTLPYAFLRSDGQKVNGIGDVLLNYRHQALFESEAVPAFAPRISLILPTGNERKGTGTGSFGFQSNLPLSKVVSDRVTLHANAGMTNLFDVQGRSPTSYNLGGSVVYAVTPDFNLLFEAVAERTETVADHRIEKERALTLAPGVRFALNFSDLQVVAGLGVPVRLTKEKPDYGILFYLSFEHKFLR